MKLLLLTPFILLALLWFFFLKPRLLSEARPIDSYKGVPVYFNGENFIQSSGVHYHWTGYYYGQKWQCVEFIKRFLYLHKNLRMPEVMGNAIDFFDRSIPHRNFNPQRGMFQYLNGGDVPPEADDLIVFNAPKNYGHVAIVTEIEEDFLVVIQQNVGTLTRQKIPIEIIDDQIFVGDSNVQAIGWLRVPPK